MITDKKIRDLVEQIIDGIEIFIVGIVVKPSNKIFVEIDTMVGIKISECAKVSRQIERHFEESEEEFELNVSSPGLTSAFKVFEQYEKNIGRKIDIKNIDGDNFSGVLKEANRDEINIGVNTGKKGNAKVVDMKLKINEIKSAKLIIQF